MNVFCVVMKIVEVLYDKCKHIIYVCDVCNDKLYNKFSNKCSVCNQYSNVVERCYVIN